MESADVNYSRTWFSSIYVGGTSSSAMSGGAISGMGCLVLQLFATGGNGSYLDFGSELATHGTRGTKP
jgi:hypothetical protein